MSIRTLGRLAFGLMAVLGWLPAGAVAAPPAGPLPDPTVPSPRLQKAMMRDKPAAAAPTSQVKFQLRGRVIAPDRTPLALLEVDGKMILVGKGQEVGSGPSAFKVVELSKAIVRVEIVATGQTQELR